MALRVKYSPTFGKIARRHCLVYGATNRQLAEYFGVDEKTIYRWCKKYPEFEAEVNKGRFDADAAVIESTYRMAMGFREKVKKSMVVHGELTEYEDEVYIPPSITAAIWWMKNRRPNEWRDKHEITRTGDKDNPVEMVIRHEIVDASQREIEEAEIVHNVLPPANT